MDGRRLFTKEVRTFHPLIDFATIEGRVSGLVRDKDIDTWCSFFFSFYM